MFIQQLGANALPGATAETQGVVSKPSVQGNDVIVPQAVRKEIILHELSSVAQIDLILTS